MKRRRLARPSSSRIGSEAPDFAADVLGENRQRTGQQVSLSDLRGSPVGLIFGSFT